jgi:hypothetical protein
MTNLGENSGKISKDVWNNFQPQKTVSNPIKAITIKGLYMDSLIIE